MTPSPRLLQVICEAIRQQMEREGLRVLINPADAWAPAHIMLVPTTAHGLAYFSLSGLESIISLLRQWEATICYYGLQVRPETAPPAPWPPVDPQTFVSLVDDFIELEIEADDDGDEWTFTRYVDDPTASIDQRELAALLNEQFPTELHGHWQGMAGDDTTPGRFCATCERFFAGTACPACSANGGHWS